jgi:PBSX family phage portal protein
MATPPKSSAPAGRVTAPVDVAKAVREAGGTERGKVMKVLYYDDAGNAVGEWSSTQIPEDAFSYSDRGIQEPPYRMEQLVYLAEQHPIHSSALEQKTVDVCGTGWNWEAIDEEAPPNPEALAEITSWFESLAPDDESMQEVISAAWNDVETVGWGLIEVARDPQGLARKLYHVPGHTVRAHRDGFRLVQIRGQKKVWFRRWGAETDSGEKVEVDSKTGSLTKINDPANDLFVIRKKSRRSSWYGIPIYISAVGWLALALAARDDNIQFFANRREPRWAIILTNLEDDPDVEEDIRRAFTVDLKQPHRNIIVPIAGDGKIDFQQLSGKGIADGTFEKLSERADKAILVSHRIPGERIASVTVGTLGGNLADEVNRVYKEGVVAPSQALYDQRLNRLIQVEWERAHATTITGEGEVAVPYQLVLDDLDIETERQEAELSILLFHADVITLGEARRRMGMEPVYQPPLRDETGAILAGTDKIESEYNDMLFTELPGASGAGGSPGAAPTGAGLEKGAGDNLDGLRTGVATLLLEARENHARIQEYAQAASEDG